MPSMRRSHRSDEAGIARRPRGGIFVRGDSSAMTKLISGLAALCLASMFAPSAAFAQNLGPTLQKIKDSGAITIGNRDSSVPFSYLDDIQKPIGFSLDLCDLVVAKIKTKLGLPALELAYQALNSSNRVPLVQSDTDHSRCTSAAH